MRFALAPLLLLAACQRAEPPANQAEAAPPPQPTTAGDISAAEDLVRRRLGGREIRFSGARRSASEGVSIVCGFYEQEGARRRYIVVGDEDAFVESQMVPGEMERAVREFCREGGDNGPARRTPPSGEKG